MGARSTAELARAPRVSFRNTAPGEKPPGNGPGWRAPGMQDSSEMTRTLTVLFRRNPARDRDNANVAYEGYEMLWPDGRPLAVGLEAFCKHGQRLLGLGRHLGSCPEKLI